MTLFIRGNTIIDAAGGQSVDAGDFLEGLREGGREGRMMGTLGRRKGRRQYYKYTLERSRRV